MFTKGKTPEAPPPVAPKPILAQESPARRAPTVASRSGPSIISADMKIVGGVASQGEIEIFGQVEGDVRASSVTIGENGAVKGKVVAESVVVRGTIEGRIHGRKVQLCTGAKVHGDIFHASLAIEPNALFEGAVKHAQDPMQEDPSPGHQPNGPSY